jgi:hypothetical protein
LVPIISLFLGTGWGVLSERLFLSCQSVCLFNWYFLINHL